MVLARGRQAAARRLWVTREVRLIDDLPVESDRDIGAVHDDLVAVPLADWMYDQWSICRGLE